jgi:hypothetical protein
LVNRLANFFKSGKDSLNKELGNFRNGDLFIELRRGLALLENKFATNEI